MTLANKQKAVYVPGTYAQKKPDAAQRAAQYFREWEKKRRETRGREPRPAQIAPAICFSRKTGVGALEIADILAETTGFRVADREILEQMAQDAALSKETVAFFDERYPGKMSELSAMLFGEKSFTMSDYLRNFVSAVFAFADMGSTIFVGRGTHLILPRDRVLAVRFIGSAAYRIKRLADILDVAVQEAEAILGKIDKEQQEFFKKAFGKRDAPPYEFDMVINCDYITEPRSAAAIVAQAFRAKFASA
ncbi:MAG: cytidylate kinase-like family protein [Desulfobacterales bacterium]|nr:MAG: cytidylate kinase-like family protein [Desulfobacterales bacterium]